MRDEFKIEAKIDFKCRNCSQHTAIPVLRVIPGVKCRHCGAVIELDKYAMAMKSIMLMAASSRNDIKVD